MLQRSITLMKPITWFAPLWAFMCGAIASGALTWSFDTFWRLFLGIIMAGPVLCGLSQIVNDYCDSEVDAINEPNRLIPAGLISARHVQVLTIILLAVGCVLAWYLGPVVALMVGIGLLFAVAYSMKPIRAKRNGWIGNALVSFSYEGLAWLAGHATFAVISWHSALLALLYSLGAHGIMTVNDFKSIPGDTRMGIRSIPVMYGKQTAAWLVVGKMALTQLIVIALLVWWGNPVAAGVVGLFLLAQMVPFVRFVRDPEHNAVFFNATAIMLFVWGMLAAAIGLAA
jgi:chlorophyll synthase